jgi:hypothetical protein
MLSHGDNLHASPPGGDFEACSDQPLTALQRPTSTMTVARAADLVAVMEPKGALAEIEQEGPAFAGGRARDEER